MVGEWGGWVSGLHGSFVYTAQFFIGPTSGIWPMDFSNIWNLALSILFAMFVARPSKYTLSPNRHPSPNKAIYGPKMGHQVSTPHASGSPSPSKHIDVFCFLFSLADVKSFLA